LEAVPPQHTTISLGGQRCDSNGEVLAHVESSIETAMAKAKIFLIANA